MDRRLAIQQGRGFWASRGTAIAVIAALHSALVALALLHRAALTESEPALVSINLLTPTPRPTARVAQPAPTPRFETPEEFVLLPPEFVADASQTMSESAIAQEAPQVDDSHSAPLQISRAEYLRAPVLRYPPAALAARREGSVGLRVLVSPDGRVLEVEVERPSGFAPFDEAACNAVRAALFKPYRVNGEARSVLIRIPFDFTLKRRV